MNISFAFKNFEPSEHLKKYARRRIEKLERFFGKSSGLDVSVVLIVDKFRHRCEVTVTGESLHINASEQSNDMYAAIDLVSEKVESQIKRQVSRVKEHRRKTAKADIDVFTWNLDAQMEEGKLLHGTDRFAQKPMHIDEAIMQLDTVGSEFFVFFNAESSRVNVVYRRRAGGYALIDPVL